MNTWKGLAMLGVSFAIANPASAMNCRVVEYLDHTEAICDDELQSKDEGRNEPIRTQQISRQRVLTIPTDSENILPTGDLKVFGIVALAESENIERRFIKVNITCNVESKYIYDNLIVTIVGKDFNGNEKTVIPVLGNATAESITLFTGSVDVPSQKYHDVRTWDLKEITFMDVTYSIIARESYGLREYNTYKAINRKTDAPLEKQIITTPNRDSGFIIFAAKNGNVLFNEQQHLGRYGYNSDLIVGINKDKAHATCKGCHATNGAGPTKCGGCHKK